MCCEPSGYTHDDANGVCPDCGEDTCDGDAIEQCGHAQIECDTCCAAYCDGGC